jgi:hypothetical protein
VSRQIAKARSMLAVLMMLNFFTFLTYLVYKIRISKIMDFSFKISRERAVFRVFRRNPKRGGTGILMDIVSKLCFIPLESL